MVLKEILKNRLLRMNDSQIVTDLHILVSEERKTKTEVLWHLMEIENRMIHLKKGYSTVFAYAVKELKYSEAAAGRRIILNRFQVEKLEKLKGLLSHRNPDHSWVGLIELIADMTLKQIDPEQKAARCKKRADKAQEKSNPSKSSNPRSTTLKDNEKMNDNNIHVVLASAPPSPPSPPSPPPAERKKAVTTFSKRVAINVSRHRQVLAEAGYQCTFVDIQTHQRCQSKSFLQVDHIVPIAQGGTNELSNLRILCFKHNQLEAVMKLGIETMQPYI
jgi:5-methylcytosine-specific restriction endonuclease McrA